MRNVKNIINTAALFCITSFMSTGCMLEKEGPSEVKQNVMIEMTVSDGAEAKSAPTAAEEVINSLRIYAFYGDKLAGYALRQATALRESFYMDLELPQSGTHNVDFYLIANESEMSYENTPVSLSSDMTKAQLEAIRFTGLTNRNVLPMYCKQTEPVNVDALLPTYNTQGDHKGHLVLDQKINFSLARSLAKLSVYAAKVKGTSVEPRVISVELLANGTREYSYLFPQTDAVLNAIVSRANNRVFLTNPVSVTKEVEKGSEAALNPDNYTSVFTNVYLPEVTYGSSQWNVSSGNDREAVLHVKCSLGENQDILNGYVYLPGIRRNQHIKVCILINSDGQIVANYDVADWDWDEDRMENWFFDYPTHTYIWHRLPENEDDLHTKPGISAVMSEAQPFKGYFQMTYPTSDMWKPTLEGLHSSHCSVNVYNERTGQKVFSSESPVSLPVSEDWFRIEVVPKTGYMDAGDVVNLAITYTPGGFTESEYLLINGSYPDFFWEESTSENYVTITMVN